MAEVDRYNEETLHCRFRARMMERSGFINYGISAPGTKKATSIKEANLNMVQWIIDRLEIKADSNVLEIGCGKGSYLVEIAKRTGCRFTGVDIITEYVQMSTDLAAKYGVENQGKFHVAGYENIGDVSSLSNHFSHILCIGSFLYVHPTAGEALKNIASISDNRTKIFLFDLERQKDWEECRNAEKHLRLDHPLMNSAEFKIAFDAGNLCITDEVDLSHRVLPSLELYAEKSVIEDPTSQLLTYPYMAKAFRDAEIKYKAWTLIQQP